MDDEKMVVETETFESTNIEEAGSGVDLKLLGLGGAAIAAAGTLAWRKRDEIKAALRKKREEKLEKKVEKLGNELLKIRKEDSEEAKTEE